MKILIVTSEALPFSKATALANAMEGLPKELKANGVDVRVMLPKYSDTPKKFSKKIINQHNFTVDVSWRNQPCSIGELVYNDVPHYFIENSHYFNRKGLYGFDDDAERFVFFCYAVLEAIYHMDFKPDIIHCNDWQTGVLPILLKEHYKDKDFYKDIRTVFTVHNLKNQGIFIKEVLHDLLSLGDEYYNIDGLEFFGHVNYLKAGLMYSDKITTVSPTYAEELQHTAFGENLDGVFRLRRYDLIGILNGVDYSDYDPNKDADIFVNYQRSFNKKLQNKEKLQELLGLPVSKKTPLIAIMTPLVSSKGLDLICCSLDKLMDMDIQIVVLGEGDKKYEIQLQNAAKQNPSKLSVNISYDKTLVRKIYASSDMFLIPSLFEPYSVETLVAMRYGSVPIAIQTGSLKDTIIEFDEIDKAGNGFSFTNFSVYDMISIVSKAVNHYKDKKTWEQLVKNTMKTDYSWSNSAKEYLELYEGLINS